MSLQEFKKQLKDAYNDGEWDIPLLEALFSKSVAHGKEHLFVQAVEAVAFELQDPSLQDKVATATNPLLRKKRNAITAGQ